MLFVSYIPARPVSPPKESHIAVFAEDPRLYFYPDYKKKISKTVKEKINRYMYTHTNWKPAGSDTVNVDLYLQFGVMYLHLKYEGEEIKIKFADIERMK